MSSKLRVLQFITPSGFYGAERWVLALARNVDLQHVSCDLAVSREDENQDLTLAELFPTNEHEQVHFLTMKGRFDPSVIRSLCRVIRNRNIDIIHTHGYKSDILGLIAARLTGIRCVSTPHGFSGKVGWKLGAFIWIGTKMLRYFDRVAPLSEELLSDMSRFGVPDKKVVFIPNGVDLTEIDEVVGRQAIWHRDTRGRMVGFIGQMIPRKGLGDLLEIFDKLYQSNTELQLQLIGDGRQRDELERQAKQQVSGDAIRFLGFRSDRLELLVNLDLFVMTSSLEGIPRCMMEAMAVGVPVVAYDIPGVDQLVEHRKTGLLATYGDREALAECCREILEDPELAQSLATAARERIRAEYSAERMAREYEALFARLTGKTSPANPGSRVVG